MLSDIKQPNKVQLIKKIQLLSNPQIKLFEITDTTSINTTAKSLQTELRKGSYSLILIRN